MYRVMKETGNTLYCQSVGSYVSHQEAQEALCRALEENGLGCIIDDSGKQANFKKENGRIRLYFGQIIPE